MQLSARLKAVVSMVTPGNIVVEAGCDHGYIPIYLVEEKIVPSAIAMDINRGPLERAKEHIKEHKLEKVIETRLSDGVKALDKGEGDTLIIAGMGGGLVIKILEEGKNVLGGFKEFILQPQSELEEVRKYLMNNGFKIIQEDMIIDEGKYYPMFKVIYGTMDYDIDIFFKYGKILLENRNSVLEIFLNKELQLYLKISKKLRSEIFKEAKDNIIIRKREVDKEIEYIKEALKYYE